MVLDTSRSRRLLPSEWRKRFVFGFEVWIEQFFTGSQILFELEAKGSSESANT